MNKNDYAEYYITLMSIASFHTSHKINAINGTLVSIARQGVGSVRFIYVF